MSADHPHTQMQEALPSSSMVSPVCSDIDWFSRYFLQASDVRAAFVQVCVSVTVRTGMSPSSTTCVRVHRVHVSSSPGVSCDWDAKSTHSTKTATVCYAHIMIIMPSEVNTLNSHGSRQSSARSLQTHD